MGVSGRITNYHYEPTNRFWRWFFRRTGNRPKFLFDKVDKIKVITGFKMDSFSL
jgi:hypothetical protein